MIAAPYRGLAPFTEADAALFFGREKTRRVVVANMESEPLTILYGPSGVGKTSFLHASVLHHFKRVARLRVEGGGAPELAALVFSRWRDDPIESLRTDVVDAVFDVLGHPPPSNPPEDFTETTTWAAASVSGSLYILLDQVEEYFLYWATDDAPGSFAAEFPRAVNAAAGRVGYLLCVREDRLGQLDQFKGQIPGLFSNYLRLDHLDRDAGREAIERPLEVWNATRPEAPAGIEPALVEEVLDSTSTGMAAAGSVAERKRDRIEAPYLQVVLNRVWQEERAEGSSVLRHETLARLGGSAGIIRRSVENAMAALAPEEEELAANAVRYLVTPSGSRIALSASDLSEFMGRPHAKVLAVLERLGGGDVRVLRAIPGSHGETLYEVFSDQLVAGLLAWRTRLGAQQEQRAEELVLERQELLVLERRRVRRLRAMVWLLGAIALFLAVALLLALD